MPQFQVRVFIPGQGAQLRLVDAADRQALAQSLGVPAHHVLEAQELASATRPRRLSRRFPLQLFSQELSVLLDAGISLLEALATLREKEPNAPIRLTLDALSDCVERGQPLSTAMREQPQAFDELICALVAANERTGQLSIALAQHARYLAWVETLRSRLVAACIYPAMLLAVGSAVILFLLLFVLPRFAGILDGLGEQLPWGSRLLINFGQTAGAHPEVVLGLALGLGLSLAAVLRSAGVRARLQGVIWMLPSLGPRLQVLTLARLYRSLGMLLGAGVPALRALEIVRDVVALPWRHKLDAATEAVARGERLSDALQTNELTTPAARRMVRVGERSGTLPAMLERAASFHDDEAVRVIEMLTRAINPALMLVMGVMIGGIVVLMYLPIFQLVEQVQ